MGIVDTDPKLNKTSLMTTTILQAMIKQSATNIFLRVCDHRSEEILIGISKQEVQDSMHQVVVISSAKAAEVEYQTQRMNQMVEICLGNPLGDRNLCIGRDDIDPIILTDQEERKLASILNLRKLAESFLSDKSLSMKAQQTEHSNEAVFIRCACHVLNLLRSQSAPFGGEAPVVRPVKDVAEMDQIEWTQ